MPSIVVRLITVKKIKSVSKSYKKNMSKIDVQVVHPYKVRNNLSKLSVTDGQTEPMSSKVSLSKIRLSVFKMTSQGLIN